MKLGSTHISTGLFIAFQVIVVTFLAVAFVHQRRLLSEAEDVQETLSTAVQIDRNLIEKQKALIENLKENA